MTFSNDNNNWTSVSFNGCNASRRCRASMHDGCRTKSSTFSNENVFVIPQLLFTVSLMGSKSIFSAWCIEFNRWIDYGTNQSIFTLEWENHYHYYCHYDRWVLSVSIRIVISHVWSVWQSSMSLTLNTYRFTTSHWLSWRWAVRSKTWKKTNAVRDVNKQNTHYRRWCDNR